jgi:hypothetical protein
MNDLQRLREHVRSVRIRAVKKAKGPRSKVIASKTYTDDKNRVCAVVVLEEHARPFWAAYRETPDGGLEDISREPALRRPDADVIEGFFRKSTGEDLDLQNWPSSFVMHAVFEDGQKGDTLVKYEPPPFKGEPEFAAYDTRSGRHLISDWEPETPQRQEIQARICEEEESVWPCRQNHADRVRDEAIDEGRTHVGGVRVAP